jgi:hypothetical protein
MGVNQVIETEFEDLHVKQPLYLVAVHSTGAFSTTMDF